MFILGHLLSAVAAVLSWVLGALQILILVRVVLSWVNADPYNPIVRILVAVAEPFLRPFRRLLPPWKTGGIDWSPVIAFLCILFIDKFLVPVLYEISARLQ